MKQTSRKIKAKLATQDIPGAEKALRDLAAKWPRNIVARSEIASFSGGMVAPGKMANLDSLGLGVPRAFRVSKKVVYPVDAVIHWFLDRMEA